MSEDKKPWWYPKPVTPETVQRMDDEEVLNRADKLADEIFRLEAEVERLRLLVRTIVFQSRDFSEDRRDEIFKLAGIEQ